MAQTGSPDQREGASGARSRNQFRIVSRFGARRGLVDQIIAALGFAFEFEMSGYYVENVSRDLEKIGRIALPEFKLDLRNRLRRVWREDLSFVDRQYDIGTVSTEMIGRALDPGLKNRLQLLAYLVGENLAECSVFHPGDIWLVILDRLFPLRPFEQADAWIG